MKVKLLKKVKRGVFATKVKKFGFDMYRIEVSFGSPVLSGYYAVSRSEAIDIVREVRLKTARDLFRKKKERRESI